jgi:tRNA (guanosine-2'-O-)-methyltransferase
VAIAAIKPSATTPLKISYPFKYVRWDEMRAAGGVVAGAGSVAWRYANCDWEGGRAPLAVVSGAWVRTRTELRSQRRPRANRCWDHVIAAPLWPKHGVNLGTLLRTCDAVGACLAVPREPWINQAVAKGNTLRQPSCIHRIANPLDWLTAQRERGTRIVGVELADDAVRLADLPAARERTVMVLGHETDGIPYDALALLDVIVEIPMVGTGLSLNVAVAGSLVLYRLAGLL